MPVIEIDYAPRPQQLRLHEALERYRFVVAVAHRRMGKTVCAVNHLLKAALTCSKPRPRFHYIAPTFRQGKAACWDYLKHYSAVVPGVEKNESELRVNFPNGAQVQILGSDNADSMRGIYSDGAVFDEYGMQPANVFTEVMRPAFADRMGWAMFIGTPNGKNQFYDIAQQAKLGGTGDDWFFAEYKASQTGLIVPAELAAARSVMTQDEYDQEFECSFEAAVKGAIYSDQLAQARADNRITRVPYEPLLHVDTDWDLGVGDATAIWFTQSLKTGEIRVIDYYEASGEGLPHYAGVLKAKPYSYGSHWAPHDIQVREFTSGRSRIEAAQSLGISFKIQPKHSSEDGIHAARLLFPKCWFDADKCKAGLEALQHYRRDYNSRLNEFKDTPVHDWASHAADAFRGLASRQTAPKERKPGARMPMTRSEHGWMS
jgi:phage terminase large subunit